MEPDVQIRPGAGDHFWEGCTTKLSKQWCCVINAIMYLHKKHDLNTEQKVKGTLLQQADLMPLQHTLQDGTIIG